MKVLKSITVHLKCGVAAAALALCAAPAPAQTPKPAVKAPTAGLIALAPKGPGSLTGVWFNIEFSPVRGESSFLGTLKVSNLRTADGMPPPLQPWAAAVVAQRKKGSDNGKPYAKLSSTCVPEGAPSMMFDPASIPIQILETPGQVTILFEELTTFRIIRMNDKHPADPDPSLNGDSVGHWEGDTLVVDTVALSTLTSIGDMPHSEELHMVERFRRTGKDALEYRVTLNDPKTFTRPFTYIFDYKHVPGEKLTEWLCTNNRNKPDASGSTSVQLQ